MAAVEVLKCTHVRIAFGIVQVDRILQGLMPNCSQGCHRLLNVSGENKLSAMCPGRYAQLGPSQLQNQMNDEIQSQGWHGCYFTRIGSLERGTSMVWFMSCDSWMIRMAGCCRLKRQGSKIYISSNLLSWDHRFVSCQHRRKPSLSGCSGINLSFAGTCLYVCVCGAGQDEMIALVTAHCLLRPLRLQGQMFQTMQTECSVATSDMLIEYYFVRLRIRCHLPCTWFPSSEATAHRAVAKICFGDECDESVACTKHNK